VSEQISGESEYVKVGVEASMSEIVERACHSCGSELVEVIRVRVYTCQSVCISECTLVILYASHSVRLSE
jgi:hypothetical protein